MWTVTYEVWTPDSVEHGESVEVGFVTPGDWHWPVNQELTADSNDLRMTLREAMALATPDQDCGRWFSETGEDRCDYATGAVEIRAIHPPQGITASSYARVKRLLNIR